MLAVGRERARERGHDHAVTFEQGNAEELPYPDRSFDCVTIAFGIRNVPRIERALTEAYRVLKLGGRFLCLEFSSVDLPGLSSLYDVYSHNVIPRIGEAVTGDREAYNIWSNRSANFRRPERFRRDDRGRRLPPRLLHDHDRRRGGAAFGLEVVIVRRFSHLTRLARAGFVFAREGVFALVDTRPLPLPAKTGDRARPPDRTPERERRFQPARRRADQAGADLRQARPVPGHPPRRGRQADRARSGKPAGQDGAVSAKRGGSRRRRRVRQAADGSLCQLRPAGRRRLDRASASRRSRRGRRAQSRWR